MYGKVFASLWDGSLYGQSDPQLVFLFLIARADRKGFVDVGFQAIAGPTGLSLERVRAAVAVLEAPDPQSRTPDLDGARLERIDSHRDWGWRIVNHAHYRELRDEDTRRVQNAEAQARRRARQQESAPVSTSHHESPKSAHADADAEARESTTRADQPRAGQSVAAAAESAAAAARLITGLARAKGPKASVAAPQPASAANGTGIATPAPPASGLPREALDAIGERLASLPPAPQRPGYQVVQRLHRAGVTDLDALIEVAAHFAVHQAFVRNPFAYYSPGGAGFTWLRQRAVEKRWDASHQAILKADADWLAVARTAGV